MTKHVCPCIGCEAHQGSCPTIVDKGRCTRCARSVRRRRGTTTEQGLGWQHQQRRSELILGAIGTNCPDCGRVMVSASEMVADHSTQDRSRPADRVHCRPCSDRQGGRLAHR